jgi:N12 class adenine-specific DNA methylase/adenine-specific DNA methylase
MQDAAQFSLGLFQETALGWTLDTPPGTPARVTVPITASDDDDGNREDADDAPPPSGSVAAPARNFHLAGERSLARGWPARARDNVFAIRLSKELEATGRSPTPDEQEKLLRFVGFGATDLAQNCFPLPGADGFRQGWEEIGQELAALTTREEYAALCRATQYAHFTPEFVCRALWRAAERLGFCGGKVLEPALGTGLFFALLPPALRDACQLTGVEYDPVTARIARFIHPQARIRCEDFVRSRLGGGFDLAIGNPPFADRIVRADPATEALGLRLHDYFIAKSIARLRPGGLALFVTSTGTLDKANSTARAHIAGMADLVGAVRLPEGSFRATAGTHVVVDVLVFQRRADGVAARSLAWVDLADIPIDPDPEPASSDASGPGDGSAPETVPDIPTPAPLPATVAINRYFIEHPEMVLGTHALRRGIYGPAPSYTCLPRPGAAPLEVQLDEALDRLPSGLFTPAPTSSIADDADSIGDEPPVRPGTAADGATIKEGSYFVGRDGRLMQIIDGRGVGVAIRQGKGGEGIPASSAKIIRALLPIRDAVREVLRAQAADRPWTAAQIRLRTAYSGFVRYFGPINHTVVTVTIDKETGEERETHRRTNLAPFADDPDCWLVASIEQYDLETGVARQGPIFRDRVIAPPAAPLIATAADALAVTLNERGRVDLDSIADLLEQDSGAALAQLGTTVFRNPATGGWETADAYLSGPVRGKLAAAIAAAADDAQYQRNVAALRDVQPEDLRPSDITARLGAPWLPTDAVEAFSAEIMGTDIRVFHSEAVATWTVRGDAFDGTALGTSEWGTARRHAGQLLHDALNGGTPQIFDTVYEDGVEKRVLNVEATEAAKEKLARIKTAFTDWVWTDPDRTDRLARIYNDRFNNLVPRHFDGSHLTLPGASTVIALRPHQRRIIWRAIAAGGCYIAHAVGAGKTFSIAAAVMEQKRLGLISKAMLVVPGHCLAQASREFLLLYPTARILVADESNFSKDKRARFLARAATATWDAIIITHSAFRFIAVPAAFERQMIEDEVALYTGVLADADDDDRITRKRVEAIKEKLTERLEQLKTRKDDMLTLEEIGIDQLIVDEAQEFRKLSFRTNRTNLKGVDPDGSQRAWDLFVKARFIATKNPGRALIQASGTPITNTLGEMFSLLRFQADDALRERGVHEFDAWAAAFGDTRTELELQPSGTYKPVERFCEFINVPELIDLFRSVADVVLKDDLRGYVRLPRMRGGQRQLITAPASAAFRAYQKHLAQRIERIEARSGRVRPGDDILLAVITDGRHAAIDMRLAWPASDNEPDNKLNRLIANVHRIWLETGPTRFRQADGTLHPVPGAAQMIFSDLGTIAVEATRGFSAYRWIRQELIRLGITASEIAFIQDYKKSAEKQRLLNEVNTGRVRVVLGSSETMGTGVNAQLRLKALHHLDVPWLPSQIEQREGRIERQGNQNDEIELYAYATLGSMDATMWQNNERKARFIAAALSGDRSIRRLEDIGSQVNQFAMAKAIASGDGRLLLKAGLESEIARLQRQRAAHIDDQHDIRRRLHTARFDRDHAALRIAAVERDIERRVVTRGDLFSIDVNGRTFSERKPAGDVLLSKIRLVQLERASGTWTIGRIGGFDLVCRAVHDPREKFTETTLLLARTDLTQKIEVEHDLTSLGLIARLEHLLNRFDSDLEEQVRRRDDAIRQIEGYEPRVGTPFQLQSELDEKLARMADLEADLARTESIIADDAPPSSSPSTATAAALPRPLADAAD